MPLDRAVQLVYVAVLEHVVEHFQHTPTLEAVQSEPGRECVNSAD